jgi:cytochrome c oxidase subunit 2
MTISRLAPSREGTARLGLGIFLAFLSTAASAAYELNLPKPASPIAAQILDLHNLILMICLAIFVIVFGFMFYSVIAHRKSRGHKAAKFHDNATLEVAWTIVPFVILIGMAIPSAATLIRMEDTSRADLTVKITGYQWKWQYEYPQHEVSFFSNLSTPRDQIEGRAPKGEHYLLEVDQPLVLPTDTKVRFVITANDVIHAWWVPAFGVKKDAIPGFVNETWTMIDEPGTYRGQCAELCGRDHGFMPIVVQAVAPEEFDKWVSVQRDRIVTAQAAAGKTWTKDELMARGEKVYATSCAVCHGAKGEGVATFPKMTGSRIANGPLAEHMNIVMHGKPNTAMQAFAAQLTDSDIAAVVTYERNAFGNKAGDTVQPSQARALRK